MAYSGRLAKVMVSGTPLTLTDEVTSTTDDKTYQITDVAKRVLDRDTSVVVKEDGIETTESYTVNKLTGEIIFDQVNVLRGAITVSGNYLPMSQAAEAHEYSLSLEAENIDNTRFQDDYRRRIQGLKTASGSISQWVTVDTYFMDSLISGKPIVLELYPQATLEPFRMYAILESNEMSAVVEGLQDEAVSFVSTERMITG